MIVLGVIALVMVPLAIPAFIKYLILTVLTFTISNIIVYAYRSIFLKPVSMKIAVAVTITALLLTIAVYANQESSVMKMENISISQTAPGIGLHEAAITGNLEAIKQHIEAGSDLNEKEPMGGSCPMITAITFGKTEVALALIAAGADVNFRNNEGSTPLHTAAFFCRTEIVKALLDKGADKNIRNNAGSTALESVAGSFEDVKPIYDYLVTAYAPLGLELDYEKIKTTRPVIAGMLQ
jgi:hypothetical protein